MYCRVWVLRSSLILRTWGSTFGVSGVYGRVQGLDCGAYTLRGFGCRCRGGNSQDECALEASRLLGRVLGASDL